VTKALDVLRQFQTLRAEGQAGNGFLEILPPLDQDELLRLEKQIPCPIPEEARDLFSYARGFKVQSLLLRRPCRLSSIDLSGPDAEFGLEHVFPHAVSIADDGCGNFWVIDLTKDSKSWGPVFFACHDPAVIVYETESVAGFMDDVLGEAHGNTSSKLETICDEAAGRIWRDNPNVMPFEQCAASTDEELRAFARSLDASYEFIDLRRPNLGDGYSWGRYGPSTVNRRFGEKRIFACQKKKKWQRFKEFWK